MTATTDSLGYAPAPADDETRIAELRTNSSAERLGLIRGLIRQTAEGAEVPTETIHDIVLAVDEACQNVIRHAYKGSVEGEMTVQVWTRPGTYIVQILDQAPSVDPAKVKPRSLDDVRPGGIGTHIIMTVMDEYGFRPPPPGFGNMLRMVKRFA